MYVYMWHNTFFELSFSQFAFVEGMRRPGGDSSNNDGYEYSLGLWIWIYVDVLGFGFRGQRFFKE